MEYLLHHFSLILKSKPTLCEEVIRLYSNIYKKHLFSYIHVTLTGEKGVCKDKCLF